MKFSLKLPSKQVRIFDSLNNSGPRSILTLCVPDVPKPVIIWDPVHLDWESLRSGLIDSFQLTATNVGLIAADNLTFTVPYYWENVAFIVPEGEEGEDTGRGQVQNLGRLEANSSLSFPIEVKQIARYSLPPNR
jgi:hypothetical protein